MSWIGHHLIWKKTISKWLRNKLIYLGHEMWTDGSLESATDVANSWGNPLRVRPVGWIPRNKCDEAWVCLQQIANFYVMDSQTFVHMTNSAYVIYSQSGRYISDVGNRGENCLWYFFTICKSFYQHIEKYTLFFVVAIDAILKREIRLRDGNTFLMYRLSHQQNNILSQFDELEYKHNIFCTTL